MERNRQILKLRTLVLARLTRQKRHHVRHFARKDRTRRLRQFAHDIRILAKERRIHHIRAFAPCIVETRHDDIVEILHPVSGNFVCEIGADR